MGRNARGVVVGIAVTTAVALVIGLFVWVARVDAKDRANQLNDFRADLAAVGFANTNPKWQDETKIVKGRSKTVSVLEANVTISGCLVEMERKRDENVVASTVAGRKIEQYEPDEVNHKGKEIEIDDLAPGAIRPADLKAYLDEHERRFPCYNAA
jgi:hypothetical protein